MAKLANETLGRSIRRRGRCQRVRNNGKHKHMNKKASPTKVEEPKEEGLAGRWYPTDIKKTPIPSRKHNRKPTKLRSTCAPGHVVICLAGRFKGKRVVVLKQLESGLLLVTGPYKLNGVPLRRLNQAYVIGTSTTVDISGVNVDKIDDATFKRVVEAKKEGEFLVEESAKKGVSEERKALQKTVDEALLKNISKNEVLGFYLSAKMSLTNGQLPHLMKW